jgi:hypothetical protein
MSTQNIIFIIAIIMILVIAATQIRRGPRVTHIETRREKDGGEDA